MADYHVDRPEVEREQSPQLTDTNRSIGLIHRCRPSAPPHRPRAASNPCFRRGRLPARQQTLLPPPHHPLGTSPFGPGGHSEGPSTRSHPELGRENPPRPWYCRSSGGRVGRRQAQSPPTLSFHLRRGVHLYSILAGWSSPVARQAHNLKVVGSNPTPATIETGAPEWARRFARYQAGFDSKASCGSIAGRA